MKLIATDYDGTLNQNGVGRETIEAIRAWRLAGNKFGIVSGRGPDFLPQLTHTVGKEFDFFISCNGGYATDSNGTVFFASQCDTINVRVFVKELLSWGAPIVELNYEDRCIRIVAEESEDTYDYLWCQMPEISGFYKICTFLEDKHKVEVLAKKVDEKYGEQINALKNGKCLDIAPLGIDKAEGIRRICSILGVDERDVITVGDELNDLAMLEAFTSYGMSHGNSQIREKVNDVVDSVSDVIFKELPGL